MTTTPTTQLPDVPLPRGVEQVSPWDIDGYRDLLGSDRGPTDHALRVGTFACQASDGTTSDHGVRCYEPEQDDPVDVTLSGEIFLNSDQARELAAAEIDGWLGR